MESKSSRKKVLCIGDSLGLPGHLNSYEDTWFYKLSEYFQEYHFIQNFRRQATTDVLVTLGGGIKGVDKWPKGGDCLEAYFPEIIIIQLGIVDCAPRLLNSIDTIFLRLMPSFSKQLYINLIKRFRKRNNLNVLVSPIKFRHNFESYIGRALEISVGMIILIKICTPGKEMVLKNPSIKENVSIYNGIIDDLEAKHAIVRVVDPLNSDKHGDTIFEDGYHPNKIGHDLVFRSLINLFP